jgi:hypothetical protein
MPLEDRNTRQAEEFVVDICVGHMTHAGGISWFNAPQDGAFIAVPYINYLVD